MLFDDHIIANIRKMYRPPCYAELLQQWNENLKESRSQQGSGSNLIKTRFRTDSLSNPKNSAHGWLVVSCIYPAHFPLYKYSTKQNLPHNTLTSPTSTCRPHTPRVPHVRIPKKNQKTHHTACRVCTGELCAFLGHKEHLITTGRGIKLLQSNQSNWNLAQQKSGNRYQRRPICDISDLRFQRKVMYFIVHQRKSSDLGKIS